MLTNQYELLGLHPEPAMADDWHDRNGPYSDALVEKIKDPEGATDRKEVTSIPSPFARIHLVEEAFRHTNVAATGSLSALGARNMYTRLVSEAWDVGELFFKYDLFAKRYPLSVVAWRRKEDLEEGLLRSGNAKHRLLGETLRLFLAQDGERSNLGKVNGLHFVHLNQQMVGGTSPSTLFFSCANDLSFAQLRSGDDVFFDQEYAPLHWREAGFQRYLHGLFAVHKALRMQMPLVWAHLELSLKALAEEDKGLHTQLLAIRSAPDPHAPGGQGGAYTAQAFEAEFVAWGNTQAVEVWPGIGHRKRAAGIGQDDELTIRSERYQGSPKPRVLQNGFAKPLSYLGGRWNPATVVPYHDPAELGARFAPGQDMQCPYLTVSDFLQPVLLEVPYAIAQDRFVMPALEGFCIGSKEELNPPDNGYLLPLKPLFFRFFDAGFLQGQAGPGGGPVFRMIRMGTGAQAEEVRVELRIPVMAAGEYVLFARTYRVGEAADEARNVGRIERAKFSLGFLPFTGQASRVPQRVGLVDADVVSPGASPQSAYVLRFMRLTEAGLTPAEPAATTTRSDQARGHEHNGTSRYYDLNRDYDCIEVVRGATGAGFLIPKFRAVQAGSVKFSFAVDFGTTNTHVEYAVEGDNPRPLDIGPDDTQLVTTFDPFWQLQDPQLKALLVRELIPYAVGEGLQCQFPIRTASSETANLNHQQATFALGDLNIPFFYEKEITFKSEVVRTNLKWMHFDLTKAGLEHRNRVEKFIETLLILIRNKVVLNGGDLPETEVVWFYPSSMSHNQLNEYRKIWQKMYTLHLAPGADKAALKAHLRECSESEAPFYTYPANEVSGYTYPVVNIDIGGGTSDVVVFQERRPAFLTSFRFAGNAVFGDAYSQQTSAENGIVTTLKPAVREYLRQNKGVLFDLMEVFGQLDRSGACSSADMVAFFFSIDKTPAVRERRVPPFRFTEIIATHPELNVVFYLFVGSMVYHVAALMHALGLPMPRHVCFSGNGSRILNLLDTHDALVGVEKLSRLLFEKAYGSPYHADGLTIVQGAKPKEATAQGGILKFRAGAGANEFDRMVLLGDGAAGTVVNAEAINFARRAMKYQDITAAHKAATAQAVAETIDLLLDLHKELNLTRYFGISTANFDRYRAVLKRDLRPMLEVGLQERLRSSNATDDVEETLFFYPLVAALYRLTQAIAQG